MSLLFFFKLKEIKMKDETSIIKKKKKKKKIKKK